MLAPARVLVLVQRRAVEAREGPLVTRDGVEGMNIHHADEAVVADHEMDAAAGAEDFGAVFFESDVPGGSGHFLAHDIGGAEAGEGFADGHLSDAFLRSVKQEPADKGSPYAGSEAAVNDR